MSTFAEFLSDRLRQGRSPRLQRQGEGQGMSSAPSAVAGVNGQPADNTASKVMGAITDRARASDQQTFKERANMFLALLELHSVAEAKAIMKLL